MPILFFTLFGATVTLFYLLLRIGTLGRPALISWKSANPDTKFFLVVSAPYLLSGVALVQYLDPHDTRYPTDVGTRSPIYTIWTNKSWFRDYATDHPQLGFPRKFTDVPNFYNVFRQYGSSFHSDVVVERGDYLFTYLPAPPDRTGKTPSYHLQTTCHAYGTSCLHGFTLTSKGQIFVTSANRRATPQDTLLPPCPRLPSPHSAFRSNEILLSGISFKRGYGLTPASSATLP